MKKTEENKLQEARKQLMSSWLLMEDQAGEESKGAGQASGAVGDILGNASKLLLATAKNFLSANWAAFRTTTALTNQGAEKAISAHRQRSSQYASEASSALQNATKALDNPLMNAIGFNKIADVGSKIGAFPGIGSTDFGGIIKNIISDRLEQKRNDKKFALDLERLNYGSTNYDPDFVDGLRRLAREDEDFKKFLKSKNITVENYQLKIKSNAKQEVMQFLLEEETHSNEYVRFLLEADKNNNTAELVKNFYLFLYSKLNSFSQQYANASENLMELDLQTIEEFGKYFEVFSGFFAIFDMDEKKMQEFDSTLQDQNKRKELESTLQEIKESISKENEIVESFNSIAERYKFNKKITEKISPNSIPELENIVNLDLNAKKAKLEEISKISEIYKKRMEIAKELQTTIGEWKG